MGYLVGERFDEYVANQIISRQRVAGSGYAKNSNRDSNQLQLLTNKNAWLKCASSVYVNPQSSDEKAAGLAGYSTKYPEGESADTINLVSIGEQRLKDCGLTPTSQFAGTQLARKGVLFNTLSEQDGKSYRFRSGVTKSKSLWNPTNSYGLGGSDFGLNPAPGLISFSVKSQNRGSIRRGTLKLKCYNKFQFQMIELLYLRIGYSMLVEWGWDKYSKDAGKTLESVGSTLIEETWFDENGSTQLEMIDKIEKMRAEYHGNYDGFFGRVENFQWEFGPNGTYEIEIYLVTVGSVIESLRVNTLTTLMTKDKLKKLTEGLVSKLGEQITKSSIVASAGDSTLSQDLFADIASGDSVFSTENGSDYIDVQKVFGIDLTGGKNNKDVQTTTRYGYYIRLGTFLNKLQKGSIPIIDQNGKKEGYVQINNNASTNVCAAYLNQVSLDPRVCIVRPMLEDPNDSTLYYTVAYGWQTLRPFFVSENVKTTYDGKEVDGNILYGQTMNIYLNYEFISECLSKTQKDGTLSLYSFLTSICDGLNSSLGNINNFEVVIKDDKKIFIQDQNPISGIEASTDSKFENLVPYPNPLFEVFGYNPTVKDENNKETPYSNFVTDFGFQTRISPGTTTTIAVGATAAGVSTKNYDGTGFSKWNEGLEDRYNLKLIDPALTRKLAEQRALTKAVNEAGIIPTNNINGELGLQLKDHYENSEIDFTVWESISSAASGLWGYIKGGGSFGGGNAIAGGAIGYGTKKAEQVGNKDSTTALGVTIQGPRHVEAFGNYPKKDGITWEDYIEFIEQFITIGQVNEAVVTPEEAQVIYKDNYDFWLVNSFGGQFKDLSVGDLSDLKPTYWNYNSYDVKNGKSAFKAFINLLNNFIYDKYRKPSGAIGFIPADLHLTFEGLSGIKIYQALQIRQELLPPQYPQTLKFLISTLNHEISNNHWSSNITTLSVPNISQSPTPGAFTAAELQAARSFKSNGLPEYDGPTPNADLLRIYIQRNDWLTEKQYGEDGSGGFTSPTVSGGELSSGGDITEEMAQAAIEVFDNIHRNLPDLRLRITGGNDLYHQNNLNSAASRHRSGNAIDFVLENDTSEETINKLKDVLSAFIIDPSSKIWYLDEYGNPSEHSSGSHIHLSIAGEERGNAERLYAERRDRETKGTEDSIRNLRDGITGLSREDQNFQAKVKEVGSAQITEGRVYKSSTRVSGGTGPAETIEFKQVKLTQIYEFIETGERFIVTSEPGGDTERTYNGIKSRMPIEPGFYNTLQKAEAALQVSLEKEIKKKLSEF